MGDCWVKCVLGLAQNRNKLVELPYEFVLLRNQNGLLAENCRSQHEVGFVEIFFTFFGNFGLDMMMMILRILGYFLVTHSGNPKGCNRIHVILQHDQMTNIIDTWQID